MAGKRSVSSQKLNIEKGNSKDIRRYKKSDFIIDIIQQRIYGRNRYHLYFVSIKNKITGTEFKDWVRPEQLKTAKALNNLIIWEKIEPKESLNISPEIKEKYENANYISNLKVLHIGDVVFDTKFNQYVKVQEPIEKEEQHSIKIQDKNLYGDYISDAESHRIVWRSGSDLMKAVNQKLELIPTKDEKEQHWNDEKKEKK